MKMYNIEYEDGNFEIILAENDRKAFEEAKKEEVEHGLIFNIYEVDENYEEVRLVF